MARRHNGKTAAPSPAGERPARRQISSITRSLSTARLLARAPRLLILAVAVVLMTAGLRATIVGTPEPVEATPTPVASTDQAAQSFAETFARVYLTWGVGDVEARDQQLGQLAPRLGERGGVQPADGETQAVVWTAVVGVRKAQAGDLVTVAAQTTGPLLHLSIPVARDPRGYLYVSDYPALVGPPATASDPSSVDEEEVEDDALGAVVDRAMRNYLAANANNLLADLTPDALVSLPSEPLRVTRTEQITWVTPERRVAVEVSAEDARKNGWTLRYELGVEKSDRWYVRSVQVDPTFRERS